MHAGSPCWYSPWVVYIVPNFHLKYDTKAESDGTKESIMIRLRPHSRSCRVWRKPLFNLPFDDLLWVIAESRDRINVVKALSFKNSFVIFDNLQNNILRQLPWRVGRQGIGEDTMQDQNEIDNVGRQKFCRWRTMLWEALTSVFSWDGDVHTIVDTCRKGSR